MAMNTKTKTILISVMIVFGIAATLTAQSRPSAQTMYNTLTCTCGTCPHLTLSVCECGTAAMMRDEVSDLIEKGMSGDAIIETFIEKYGQTVLAAPTAEGFDLIAWVMPIGGVLLIGTILIFMLRRWTLTPVESETAPVAKPQKNDEYSQRIDRELDDL